MGLIANARERQDEHRHAQEARASRDANPDRRWEYHARNLAKVPGIALEDDFNKIGQRGWEFVAVADGYAIFKRPAD